MTPGTKYFIPVFIAALQLSCGKNVNADKNQASLTVLAALNRVFKSLDCMQDILQRTLDISQGSNGGVEELAVTVKDQTGEQKRVLDTLENNLNQAISAAVKKQFDEQTQTMAEMKLQLEHTFSSSVKHITDEIKNSKNSDDRFKSELERLAAENEVLKRDILDKEKQVHDLSGKLNDSQQRIKDLEENLKQLNFKVGKRPGPKTGKEFHFGNSSAQLETLPGTTSEQKLEKEVKYALSAGPNNQLRVTVKILMELNAHGKAEIENKDKQVASQNKMAEGMRECIQQQKIKELMEEFKRDKDLPAIVRGLKQIVYNDSEAYRELQNIYYNTVSPLYQIARYGYTELASLLVAGGLPVDTTINSEGVAMLDVAAAWNQLPVVKLLILHGADINAQRGPRRMTPLMWAASNGSLDVVKWLVWAGADVAITTGDGHTALSEARSQGQREVVMFLGRLRQCR